MRTFQLLVFAAFVCGSSASADTIELKTGGRIEGGFKQAAAAGAVIEVGGQAITIAKKLNAIPQRHGAVFTATGSGPICAFSLKPGSPSTLRPS